jgi:hypothetical protein
MTNTKENKIVAEYYTNYQVNRRPYSKYNSFIAKNR